MIVDIHTHVWDRPDQLGQGSAARIRRMAKDATTGFNTSAEAYDKAMEPTQASIILGFESQLLGASIPHELVADHVKRRPDKYFGFAGIDPMAPNWSDNLDRAIDLGLVGIVVSPAAGGYNPAHTRAMALYERCETERLPVLFHTGTHLDSAAMMENSQPHLLDEVGRSFPGLRVVLAQVGHPWVEPALMLINKHPNFYADLTDIVLRPWTLYNVLLSAHQQNAMDYLLIGSDFPFLTPEKAIVTIFSINSLTHGTNLPTIPREQLRSIVERDALACLGIKSSAKPVAGNAVRSPAGELSPPAAGSPDASHQTKAQSQADDNDDDAQADSLSDTSPNAAAGSAADAGNDPKADRNTDQKSDRPKDRNGAVRKSV